MRKKGKLIAVAFFILLLVAAMWYLLLSGELLNKKDGEVMESCEPESSEQITSETEPTGKEAIDTSRIEEDLTQSVGDLEAGFEIAEKPSDAAQISPTVVRPWVNWADGIVTDEDLSIIVEAVAQLYENELNKEVNGSRYKVEGALLSGSEMGEYNVQGYYSIDSNGCLVISCKLTVHDLQEETVQEIATVKTVKYAGADLVFEKGGE